MSFQRSAQTSPRRRPVEALIRMNTSKVESWLAAARSSLAWASVGTRRVGLRGAGGVASWAGLWAMSPHLAARPRAPDRIAWTSRIRLALNCPPGRTLVATVAWLVYPAARVAPPPGRALAPSVVV